MYFGKIIYYMHAIKFQKCGLPYAHIIIKLTPNLIRPQDIVKVISAELPSNKDFKQNHFHDLVKQFIIHQCTQRCKQQDNRYYWNYPQSIQESTTINEQGYVNYKCRTENNINIMLYNAFLLLKLNSHINVEVASTLHVISYLYKYIYKGPDQAKITIYMDNNDNNESEHQITDEIKDYLNAHYLSAMEATW
ncbi:7778_t:CDS:1 [Cetraspora pellucida]|uniref:7778_t:CDS:1 n=1 Tax=Cetraspora pellucida TaxID=1433469 RepID=A0A9N8WML6_9GLOM|nr:7778_t:CDS:1 [Cetraspora pellucida]